MKTRHYDVIIVGAGAGGGTVAAHVAEAGHSVLLLERGAHVGVHDVPRDHLRNHVSERYPNLLTPPPGSHPRVVEDGNGSWQTVEPPAMGHNNIANAVGGGTLVWGMQAWRMHPLDFAMATHYGVPPESSLADWPITYSDLEPYYSQAEWELGVAGDDRSEYAPRTRPYPMRPLPKTSTDGLLETGARHLGITVQAVPLALNSEPAGGRPACIRCTECIGFTCPVDAKNGAHNTMVPRALASGAATLVSDAQALAISTDMHGRVNGVEYAVRAAPGRATRERAFGRAIVLAAGAIETARLLLLSASSHHPHGLGNDSGHVGRHLQGHTYPVAFGLMAPGSVDKKSGPGPSTATIDYAPDNPGVIGGAMIANDFIRTPIGFWSTSLPPGTPRWGAANKRAMRELFHRVLELRAPVQEIPSPNSRVELDPEVRDDLGVPVARISGQLHPETVRTAALIEQRAAEWLQAAGAERVWSKAPLTRVAVAHHQAGTARMSQTPQGGVTDPTGGVHGHPNLFVADASVHVTNGGFNPALTVFALAIRTSEQIIASLS